MGIALVTCVVEYWGGCWCEHWGPGQWESPCHRCCSGRGGFWAALLKALKTWVILCTPISTIRRPGYRPCRYKMAPNTLFSLLGGSWKTNLRFKKIYLEFLVWKNIRKQRKISWEEKSPKRVSAGQRTWDGALVCGGSVSERFPSWLSWLRRCCCRLDSWMKARPQSGMWHL